jgi:hypothetical protein
MTSLSAGTFKHGNKDVTIDRNLYPSTERSRPPHRWYPSALPTGS